MSQTNLTKPNDHLKLSGPIQNITSYSNQFRNYGGINQYVPSYLFRLNQPIDTQLDPSLSVTKPPIPNSSSPEKLKEANL